MRDTLSQEYGVNVDTVGAEVHVQIVELGIRTIKKRVRGMVKLLCAASVACAVLCQQN